MRRTRALPLMLVAVLTAAMAGTALAQPEPEETATITVVHGIPDTPVDVYVNGEPAIPGFQPTTVTDPIELPVGSYDLAVYAEGADPAEDEPVLAAEDVALTADLNASVVAHLTEAGDPELTIFVNDTSELAEGDSRVAVRHTAAAPPVDVFVDGAVAIPGLTNPEEAAVDIAADTYEVAVAVAGAPIEDAVIGPVDLELPAETLTVVYAVFSAADGTIQPLVQTVDLSAAPGGGEPPAQPGERTSSRLEGPTRIETAVAISQRAFPAGAEVVYLASADDFPDALAAGSLTDGPVLLVPPTGTLPAAVADEINRLGADEVIGLGGEAAISDDMIEQAVGA